MQQVPLNVLPNQSLSFTADGDFWEVRIFQGITSMFADISVNGEKKIAAQRCVEGTLLLPYDYMWKPDSLGNLVFVNDPDWEHFADTVVLLYLSHDEALTYQSEMNSVS